MPDKNTMISQAQEANSQFHASFLRQFANQTFPKLEIADKSQSHWPSFGKV